MSMYWKVAVYSVYGTDWFAFDEYEEAKKFADEKYKEEVVYGTRITHERD